MAPDRMALPEGLSRDSRVLWPRLVADLAEVSGGHAAEIDLQLLALVLRARDRLVVVAKQLDADGVTVTGSKGQPRPHPLIAIEQRLRTEIVAGFRALRLSPREDYGRTIVNNAGRIVREPKAVP